MQEDALIGDLTVRSNLYYSALLRLPRSMPRQEKKDRASSLHMRRNQDLLIYEMWLLTD